MRSLVELLRTRAGEQGEAIAYRFLGDRLKVEAELGYIELDRRVRAVAAAVQARARRGDRALLLYPPGPDFLVAFFGCLYAGVVAVPAYPHPGSKQWDRLTRVVRDSGASLVLTVTASVGATAGWLAGTPELGGVTCLDTAALPPSLADGWTDPGLGADDLAFLQYTSGSTSEPKGVMVSHGNLLDNLEAIRRVFGVTPESRVFTWLPPYHDMGLIGGLLSPLYATSPVWVMSPLSFLFQPIGWLQAISEHRITVSGAPNFAYELCARKVKPEQLAALDLRSWRLAFSGAEVVRAETLQRFADTFAPAGFQRRAFFPVYGMAETTLLVSGGVVGEPPRLLPVSAGALAAGRVEEPPDAGAADAREVVSCGRGWNLDVAVVDPERGAPRGPREIGEVWVAGGSVARGYWNRPELTALAFHNRLPGKDGAYLRTGDLGFLDDGQLYIVGRAKELIILDGRNFYPQDIEVCAQSADPALATGGGAAFAVDGPSGEQLVLVQEIRAARTSGEELEAVLQRMRAALAEREGVQPHVIALVGKSGVPRTTSGKIQRLRCRELFLSGKLREIARSVAGEKPAAAPAVPPAPVAEAAPRANFPCGAPAAHAQAQAYERLIAERIAARIGLAPAQVERDAQFNSFGLDSKTLVGLAGELSEHLGRPLPPTLLYGHPTVAALARFLAGGEAAGGEGAPEAEPAVREPIAIVGMACRLPGGAADPERFWALLRDRVEAVGEIPAGRWDVEAFHDPDPAAPGKMYTRRMGAIDGVDRFDARLFGIAPREAQRMDPQQRLLLEACWEALESAGIAPDGLQGSRTGVFVGMSTDDFGLLPFEVDAYTGTGNVRSAAAGRVSYTLGLQGPSLVVDTACSSSLVAVHLACQSLLGSESELALAGGVNLILSPEGTVAMSKLRALSPSGRCRAFDAGADGYVRAEGCGVVVLKRLSAAQRDGDRVLAVIRGSAVNQDGRSNGLTAPSGPAQEEVIRTALRRAQVQPAEVDYVEAHGTGTELGDPIELQALDAVLSRERPAERPLQVGSVKTNVGHLEAAAGMAGLLKVVLALQHEEIPPQLHFDRPNPHLDWSGLRSRIVTAPVAWPRGERPRRAGLSSFGITGTNAHLILEEAPAPAAAAPRPERSAHLLLLSARSATALRALAGRHAEALAADPEAPLADVCASAYAGRARLEERLALTARSAAEAAADLRAFAAGELPARARAGQASARPRRTAFLFTGQGSQYAGMGRSLFAAEPVFRAALERCDALAAGKLERSLLRVVLGQEGDGLIDETGYTQPALFALGYALAELWRSWGIVPDVVLGHSVGELTAACVAGLFDLEEALSLVIARGALMQALPRGGAMAAVRADARKVQAAIGSLADRLSIAAFNGPDHVVISGSADAVAEVRRRLEQERIKSRALVVSHAFHSPLMQPILAPLEEAAGRLHPRATRIPIVSNLSGKIAGDEIRTAAYWRRHVREPVRFAESMEALHELGVDALLELGPHPTLLGMGSECVPTVEGRLWLPSLRNGRDDLEQLLESAGGLHVAGHRLDPALFGAGRRKVPLPTYPFERVRHWPEGPRRERSAADGAVAPVELYRLGWERQDLPEGVGAPAGRWIVLEDRGGVGAALRIQLEQAGLRCASLVRGAEGGVGLNGRDDLRGLLADAPDGEGWTGVVNLWPLDAAVGPEASAADVEEALHLACGSALEVTQAVQAARLAAPPALWLVTRGALTVNAGERPALAQASLDGLVRTLAAEAPELRCRQVDLDGATPELAAASLARELAVGDSAEVQIAHRDLARHVVRLVPAEESGVAQGGGLAVRADATYLVTGGLGALGLQVAAWLVRRGARHLVLAGRRGLSEEARSAVERLLAMGAEVRVAAVDVAGHAAVAALLGEIAACGPPLRGVIHAAGVLDDGLLRDQRWERFAAVLAPKALGAWNLHLLTRHAPLDFFVLFSSAAALLGAPGQASYVAANAFLDALAHARRSAGLPAASIAWGPWATEGMAARTAARGAARLGAAGLAPIETAAGLAVLARAATAPSAHLGALAIDWPVFMARFAGGPVPPLLARWAAEVPAAVRADAGAAELGRALRSLAPPERRRRLLEHLGGRARAVLGMASDASIDPDQPLSALGLDSLMAVQLRNGVSQALGVQLDATLLYDHPSLGALSRFLADELGPADAPVAAPPPVAATAVAAAGDAHEPIAIVGMATRFPGADDLAAFWELLREGRSGVVEAPADRFDLDALYDPDPAAPGKMYSKWGGFLKDIDRFDPRYFDISPAEAAQMDPQQRLLLEVVWQALDDAGQRREALEGAPVGVFVGISGVDYARLQEVQGRFEIITPFTGTGNALSIAANRVSYLLGLRGPSMAVDTACSSSLVAFHLACRSLRQGESAQAIVAGVNAILTPEVTIAFSRATLMAPDGRCKTFDAAADGFVRGEGAGAVVLKRLSQAQADGDRIYAVVLGSAVNNDGRSNGLMAPSRLAQVEVIRKAHRDAGIDPAAVGYVEAHGTGTKLGDPIEASALGAVLAASRPAHRPCLIGSVKTNIGHLESAAGIAGLIKVALSLHHGVVPPSIHFQTPSPLIPFDELRLRVCAEATPWRDVAERPLAGVSAFGFGGTNAHAVLAAAPARSAPTSFAAAEPPLLALPISAHTAEALRAAVADYARLLEAGPLDLRDVCATAALRRSHGVHRLVALGRTREELAGHLRAAVEGEERVAVQQGTAPRDRTPRVGFVFPGQGPQWRAMGRGLAALEPAFRAALEEHDAALRQAAGWSLVEALAADPAASRLEDIEVVQPALAAVEASLAQLWRAYGIEPEAVIGHSMGEVAAAEVAGALTVAQATEVIVQRGRLFHEADGSGTMAVAALPREEVEALLGAYGGALGFAVQNSPGNTVVSGPQAAVAALLADLEARGVFCRRLKVNVPAHSPAMEPLAARLEAALADLRPAAPGLPFYSSLAGGLLDPARPLDGRYWREGMRRPVLFADAVGAAVEDGVDTFVELTPHPALAAAVEEVLQARGRKGAVVGSLRREEDEQLHFLANLARLFCLGAPVRWEALYGDRPFQVASLPPIPWQRRRFWITDQIKRPRAAVGAGAGGHVIASPFLGERWGWEVEVGADVQPYLADHQLFGAVVLPAASLVELVVSRARVRYGEKPVRVRGLELLAPVIVGEGEARRLQLYFEPVRQAGAADEVAASVHLQQEDGSWVPILRATVEPGAVTGAELLPSVGGPPGPGHVPLAAAEFYSSMRRRGLEYGPTFRTLEELRCAEGQAVGKLARAPGLSHREPGAAVHPTLLDGCFQAVAAALVQVPAAEGRLYLPAGLERLTVFGRAVGKRSTVTAVVGAVEEEQVTADVELRDEDGTQVLRLDGLRLARARGAERVAVAQEETAAAGSAVAPASMDRPTLEAHVRGVIREQVLALRGDGDGPLDDEAHLSTLGFDSLMLLQLRSRLEGTLRVTLSPTVAWKFPSIDKLAGHLAEQLQGPPRAGAPRSTATAGGEAARDATS